MGKNENYILLKPLLPEQHRKNFLESNASGNSISPFEFFKPIIRHFEKFAVNRFFWFIVDFMNWRHPYGGGAIEQMTPLSLADFNDGDPQRLHDITHPDDLPHVMAFSNYWVNYLTSLPFENRCNVKMTMYFRILNKLNEYYWIMVQYPEGIRDNNDRWIYGLVTVTDISHIKKDGVPLMSVLDTTDCNCQHFVCRNMKEVEGQTISLKLTKREIDVLHHLAVGFNSKQIAVQLNVSIKTVDNHRQSMLHKTNSRTSAELIHYCIRTGYL